MRDFSTIEYLRAGNPRQQEAYKAMVDIKIMDLLAPYQPVLAGTIPLGINLPASDLDIICEVYDHEKFQRDAELLFGGYEDFRCKPKIVNRVMRTVANFAAGGFPFEIFAQSVPVTRQNAYKHMVIEHRILELAGAQASREIRQRRQQGMKTEPAFADWLGLPGDPYDALLELSDWEDRRLAEFVYTAALSRKISSTYIGKDGMHD
ncbi:DUF4269 domain-containing protein [Paenibacillus macerans]|uniref:DUF4269 domain-containing protein n=1 Tax=Paenibacillus macerans TaxID=44252 RepID=UPI00203FF03E|nr:DUF4269 domain-containing protein [Paenibacillus macerans]MCM3700510.1 DUF4269 domain-containing protein [Paenibacillus macerans]